MIASRVWLAVIALTISFSCNNSLMPTVNQFLKRPLHYTPSRQWLLGSSHTWSSRPWHSGWSGQWMPHDATAPFQDRHLHNKHNTHPILHPGMDVYLKYVHCYNSTEEQIHMFFSVNIDTYICRCDRVEQTTLCCFIYM